MTSFATHRVPSLPARPESGALRMLTVLVTSFTRAVDTARAYDEADSSAARRRVLDDFARGMHRAA